MMAIRTSTQTQPLKCDTATPMAVFDVTSQVSGTVQVSSDGTPITDAVFTLKRSNDAREWHNLEGVGIDIGPGTGMSDAFDLSEFVYLGVEVTTADSAAPDALVTVHLVRED